MKPTAARGLLLVLLIAMLIPVGHARFHDPLYYDSPAILSVVSTPARDVVGHSNGLVTAVQPDRSLNVWSLNPLNPNTIPVRDVVAIPGFIVAAQSNDDGSAGALSALHEGTGFLAWTRMGPPGFTAVAADADVLVAGRANGTVERIDPGTGATVWTANLPLLAYDLGFHGTSVLAAAGGTLQALDPGTGQATASLSLEARRIATTSTQVLVIVGGSLQAFTLDGAQFQPAAVPNDLPTGLTALDADADLGRILLGDEGGRLFVYDEAWHPLLPMLDTGAGEITSLDLRTDRLALVGFLDGTMGQIPLEPRPLVHLTWPYPGRYARSPLTVTWDYSRPGADPGDTVRHAFLVRVVDEPHWRLITVGESPVEPSVRNRWSTVDLSALPSGTQLQARIQVKDKGGVEGFDYVDTPFTLDHEPPTFRGGLTPSPGEIVFEGRPVLTAGHGDRHSGVEPTRTRVLIDGTSAGVQVLSQLRAYTEARPVANLSDGRHTWRIEVYDAAGNMRADEAAFFVDRFPPEATNATLDQVGHTLAAISFRTGETARCAIRAHAVDDPEVPGVVVDEERFQTQHSVLFTDLRPAMEYRASASCSDTAGRTGPTATLLTFKTTAPTPGEAPPVLTVETTPRQPDGFDGWYVSPFGLKVSAAVEPSSATVWASVDGSPFNRLTTALDILNGTHEVKLFAVTEQGTTSRPAILDLKYDPSPPPLPAPTWTDTLGLLSWEPAADPESGTDQYRVEGRREASASFSVLETIEYPAHRFEDLPAGVTALRVVAMNGAGLQAVTAEIPVAAPTADVAYTVAHVTNRTVPHNGTILVGFRLAQTDTFVEAILKDSFGVERRFSSAVTVGPRFYHAFASAKNFRPGTYEAFVEVLSAGTPTRVPAGNFTVEPAPDSVVNVPPRTDTHVVRPQTVALPLEWLLAGVLVLAWALRDRRD